MKKSITITKKELDLIVKQGSEWSISKNAEEYIDKLATLKDWIDEAFEELKKNLVSQIANSEPTLRTIRGKTYTAFLRPYGDKYKTTNLEYQKEIKYLRPDIEKIDAYKEKEGHVPVGVVENALEVKCSFRKK